MKRDIANRERDYFGLFDPLFDEFFDFSPVAMPRRKEVVESMKTDVRENEHDYNIEIEMPGFKKEDISMDLDNGYLTVSGKKEEKVDEKDKKGNYIRRERRFGSCTRSFYVGDIKEEEIDAKLEHGVLNIVIPKKTKKIEEKKRIEIK